VRIGQERLEMDCSRTHLRGCALMCRSSSEPPLDVCKFGADVFGGVLAQSRAIDASLSVKP
jgi:hypothetical protein